MLSMTGYGKADYKGKKHSLGVEISSVNNRYLEFNIRLPRELNVLEPRIKEMIGSGISRGKVNVSINYEDYGVGLDTLVLNEGLADSIYGQIRKLRKKYGLTGEVDLGHFLSFPDIFVIAKTPDLEKKIWPSLEKALAAALREILAMRRREGAHLKKDMAGRIRLLLASIKTIEKLAGENRRAHKEKLSRRITEMVENSAIDESRLEEETAYIVDRADITEECVRFRSHLEQFREALKTAGPVGKKLNFILQELNREANTIGSKAASADITARVVELKEEIEKIREQVQNIE